MTTDYFFTDFYGVVFFSVRNFGKFLFQLNVRQCWPIFSLPVYQ